MPSSSSLPPQPDIDLDRLVLKAGSHRSPDEGLCLLEATAYLAGEPHSDHPHCASPVIAAFGRSWNDVLNDEDRQFLKPYAAKLIGTAASPEVEDMRAWMALDWLVRTYTPAWLRLAGLDDQADTMAGLPEFKKGMDVPSIRPAIDAVRTDARAAWAAAGDAAWDAAWAAAWAAAWDAARAAARAAAGDAAGDAARDAARDAAWDAAGAAARAAAWAAARAAAWAAARAAARDRLAPTVLELQGSARDLMVRMISAGVQS